MRNSKKTSLDLNQLQHLLRDKGAFSLKEVEHGVLETDGKITILKKHAYDTPTNQSLNIKPTTVPLPLLLVLDGEISPKNIETVGLSEKWLLEEITRQGTPDPKDILFAEWTEADGLYIQLHSKMQQS
ncbi:DUF421 domain-containing protein [Alkalicoccobacillus plakortidis]|uniref:DUF421 domain-containing protein n=1 Tax=Alkalicoccobacillus plakortidis TaxID=444060 RepID=UPI0027D93DA7|nr:DUF421 domain-containing protein [Alkalicoccobacillus plakortidis]